MQQEHNEDDKSPQADQEQHRQVVPDFYSNLTDQQQFELGTLGMQLVKAINGQTDNEEDVRNAGRILRDCIRRGLFSERKQTILPEDNISSIFSRGLNERKRLVSDLTEVTSSGYALDYVTHDEDVAISRI